MANVPTPSVDKVFVAVGLSNVDDCSSDATGDVGGGGTDFTATNDGRPAGGFSVDFSGSATSFSGDPGKDWPLLIMLCDLIPKL
jgi:hypothetical protein